MSKWEPVSSARFGWEVWEQQWGDSFVSTYKVARNRFGMRRWFWTRKAAQAYADKLNRAATDEEFISEESKYGQ